MKININIFQLIDIINIEIGAYYPVKSLLNKNEILKILDFKNYKKKKFFPFPILFSLNDHQKKKISESKKIKLYFKNKIICEIKINNFFYFNKLEIGKKIFQTSDLKHPGLQIFLKQGNHFICGKIKNFNSNILHKFKTKKFSEIKKKLVKKKSIVAFHTRNVPHRLHEWIHEYGIKKCKNLLINPMIFQFRPGEFKDRVIRKSYRKLLKLKSDKRIFLEFYLNYPRYAGPREALFHAIIRRNLGCTHFLVGRDHAGVKNYYKKYSSQALAKHFERKIGIKIITFDEPYFCKKTKKFSNKTSNKNCSSKDKIYISGTDIRKRLLKNQKIPTYMMRKEIISMLSKKSLVKYKLAK